MQGLSQEVNWYSLRVYFVALFSLSTANRTEVEPLECSVLTKQCLLYLEICVFICRWAYAYICTYCLYNFNIIYFSFISHILKPAHTFQITFYEVKSPYVASCLSDFHWHDFLKLCMNFQGNPRLMHLL